MNPIASNRAFLPLLVFLSMLGPLTLNILVPSLPGMVAALATSKENVQLTLSLFMLGMGFSQLMLGPLADRFGRRPVILAAMMIYCVASLTAYFAPDIEWLIAARLVQSFGAAAGISLGRTMIRDIYDRDSAASMIGYVTMGMVIAPMFSPILGAFIDDHFGWRAILIFCAALGLAMLAIAWPNLVETRPKSLVRTTAGEVIGRTIGLAGNARYAGYWGANVFASSMFFAFLGAAPYLVIDGMGRSKTEYGMWFISLSLSYMAGNFISGQLATRLGVDRLILFGNFVGMFGGLVILGAALNAIMSPAWLFLPAMIISLSNGLILPNAIAGGIGIDPKAVGAGSGLMGFGQWMVGAGVSFLAGKLSAHSTLPLALIILACAVLSMAFGHFSRRR